MSPLVLKRGARSESRLTKRATFQRSESRNNSSSLYSVGCTFTSHPVYGCFGAWGLTGGERVVTPID